LKNTGKKILEYFGSCIYCICKINYRNFLNAYHSDCDEGFAFDLSNIVVQGIENSNARALVVKAINVLLTLLQVES